MTKDSNCQKNSAKNMQGRCKGGAREMLKLRVKMAVEMLKVNICENIAVKSEDYKIRWTQ